MSKQPVPCVYCSHSFDDWDQYEAHAQDAHRLRWMLDRMEELNRAAVRAERRGQAYEAERREYQQLTREWWTCSTASTSEALSAHGVALPTERQYFRPRVIARNAITALQTSLFGYHRGRRGYTGYDDHAPELARKAAHALRKIRPDLFGDPVPPGVTYGGAIDA